MTDLIVDVPEDDQQCREFSLPQSTAPLPLEGFVVRHSGHVRAFLNRCPHTGAPLNWNPDDFLTVDGRYIQCSLHGALFDPSDGRCLKGPCVGDRLQALPIQRDGDVWRVEI